jgi:hypothetical protein
VLTSIPIFDIISTSEQQRECKMTEFTAMTQNKNGGTEAVVIDALSIDLARKELEKVYFKVLWII